MCKQDAWAILPEMLSTITGVAMAQARRQRTCDSIGARSPLAGQAESCALRPGTLG